MLFKNKIKRIQDYELRAAHVSKKVVGDKSGIIPGISTLLKVCSLWFFFRLLEADRSGMTDGRR